MEKISYIFLITILFSLYSCGGSNKNQSKSSIKLTEEKQKLLRKIDHPDYMKIVQAYADAMIAEGRDFYGTENTPLFASTLNRKTLRIGSVEDFEKIEGVRTNDRSIKGSNILRDIGLLDILYTLSELTGKEKYEDEADKCIKYFFTNCQSPVTGLMAWGEHLYWDFEKEA